MKKGVLILIFLLTLVATVSAKTVDYEGWVYNTKFLNIDNTNYVVQISKNGGTALLNSGTETKSLNLNSCFNLEFKEVCYNETSYDNEVKDYKAYFYVYQLESDITITRTVSNNILELGEKATFTTVVTNEGDSDQEITFIDEFPDGIEIVSSKNSDIINNSAYFHGELKRGESETFIYTIEGNDLVDKYIKAVVRYYDGTKEKSIYSSSIRLYSSTVVDIEFKSNKEDYEVGEEVNVTLYLENIGDDDLIMNEFRIYFPEGVTIKDNVDDLDKDGEYYLVEDLELSADETKRYRFELVAKKTGTFFVTGQGNFDYAGKTYETGSRKVGFLTHDEGIDVTSSLDATTYLYTNEIKTIWLKVKNTNSFYDIKNVTVIADSDLGYIEPGKYSKIGINETVMVLNTQFKMPDTAVDQEFYMKFNISYHVDSKEFKETLNKKIIVKPVKQVTIIPEVTTSMIEESTYTMKVKLTNPGLEDLKNVFVKTTIPKGFIVKGATSGYVDIGAEESMTVLTFTLIPEIVSDKITKEIFLDASYLSQNVGYEIEKSINVTVERMVPKIGLTKRLTSSSAYLGEIIGVSYIIENNDDFEITDILVMSTVSQGFDTLNVFNKTIDKLKPGEKITIDLEEIRAKKIGSQQSEKTIFYFYDTYKRLFNDTSGGISCNVEYAEVSNPSVYIDVRSDKTTYDVGEDIILHVNFTNLGVKRAVGTFDGNQVIIPFRDQVIIDKKISYETPGKKTVPRQSYSYISVEDNVIAYSNELELTILEKEIKDDDEVITKGNTGSGDKKSEQSESSEVTEKEVGVLMKIFNWFKSLFVTKETVIE